jgi:hypothetical protein
MMKGIVMIATITGNQVVVVDVVEGVVFKAEAR